MTTALAAMTTPSPIVTLGSIVALSPIHTFLPITTGPFETMSRHHGAFEVIDNQSLHENCQRL